MKDGTIVLGLSDANMVRMSHHGRNDPIKFNLKELGLEDRDVIIISGKDEEDIVKTIKGEK